MKIENSNISFGTKILIGDIGARTSLPKHKKAVTEGVLNAAERLSLNNINDQLVLNIKGTGKDLKLDVLDINFWNQNNEYQSSLKKKLSKLDKMTPQKISEFIINSYNKLKNSKQKNACNGYYPIPANKKIRKAHQNKINELLNSFGYDDWTCA